MPSRVADHLDAARRHRFVGREAERAIFQSALFAETLPFYVLQIFGPGGVGKTTLLQGMAALCRQHEIAAISLDARNVDPSPPAFILALQLAMGCGPETAPLDALVKQPARGVIFIDTYEKLSPEESRAHLNLRQVAAEQHRSVLEFTRGHPLALSLVADVLDQRQDQHFVPYEAPDMIKTLLERFVQKVPSPAHRPYFNPAASQELAAETLGLPFSTYRRYLKAAIMRVTEILWHKEISL